MNGSTFQQLTIFRAIVQEGSIRAAARKLDMAPPSVSLALKQLEQTLGLPLFIRTTRRIELTEAGQLLQANIGDSLSQLSMAVESVKDLGHTPSGRVRITLPRFVFQFFLKPVYAEFCRLYPDIQLEISVSDEAVDILKEGYDLGIRFGDRIAPGMVARQITPPSHEAFFASPDYVARHGLPKSLADLQQHKLVQYRFIASNQLAPVLMKQGDQDISIDMPVSLIVNDTDAMLDAAQKGLGIGRMIQPLVKEQFDTGTLIPVLEDHWYPYPGLYLYFLQTSQKAKRVRVLVDFLLGKGNGNQSSL